jgi:hypothetical protein
MSKTKVTERDTKAAILAAYEELNSEIKQLQSENRRARTQPVAPEMRSAAGGSPPTDGGGIDSVFLALAELRRSFGGTANALQGKLTYEAERLGALRHQVEAQLAQLEALHQIKPDRETLSTLIRTYNETSLAFDAEKLEKEQKHSDDLERQRAEWKREVELRKLACKERERELETKRKRDEEEYAYASKHERDLDADRYAQEQSQLQAALANAKAERERQWQEREADIAARELHLETLKARVAGFDERLEKATRAAREEGFAIANRQAKNAADLLAREHGGVIKVKELKIGALKDTLHKHEVEIGALAAKLADAQRRAQELAVKAIEGASNESSFVAMKEIALEQAKAQPKR